MEEVRGMVGMEEVSEEFDDLISEAYYSKLLAEADPDRKIEPEGMHLVLSGNPGTGKTMIAKKIAEVYGALGITPEDKIVSASRADLVAKYTGQTADKVRGLFEKARGGVLFIDEAYSLYQGSNDQFGEEALTELMALAENHRDDTVVILAGYPKEMNNFFKANSGLSSRFPKWINFPDYSASDLGTIGRGMLDKSGMVLDDKASGVYDEALAAIKENPRFNGNARDIRQLNSMIRRSVARRVAAAKNPDEKMIRTVTSDDVLEGYDRIESSAAMLSTDEEDASRVVKPKKTKKPKKGMLVDASSGE